MNAVTEQAPDHESLRALSESEEDRWQRFCASYLPVAPNDSVWRFSRAARAGDPDQGWKLHVSATILTANRVLGAVAPYLKSPGALFKAPRSLEELDKINSGLHYGYSQVGKFIAVYPRQARRRCGWRAASTSSTLEARAVNGFHPRSGSLILSGRFLWSRGGSNP